MSERSTNPESAAGLTPHDIQRGADFANAHLRTPLEEHETYHETQVRAWFDAVRAGSKKPMWLRRNFDDTSEFGAVVDFCIFDADGNQKLFAYVDVDSAAGAQNISVVFPNEEGIPEKVAEYPYDVYGTARAVRHVEAAFE